VTHALVTLMMMAVLLQLMVAVVVLYQGVLGHG